jgi:hypothetical protein
MPRSVEPRWRAVPVPIGDCARGALVLAVRALTAIRHLATASNLPPSQCNSADASLVGVYESHHQAGVAVGYRMTRDRHAAEDIAQEALLR